MRKILAILSIFCLLVSCTDKTETETNNILIKDNRIMADLLFDIHLSEGMESSNFINGNECKIIYTKIFQKYNITPEVFDEAVFYYSNHNNKHKEVYNIVRAKLESYIKLCDKSFFNRYPAENTSIWKDYAIFPDGLYKYTQFLPYYICPKPDYLNKPLIIDNNLDFKQFYIFNF
jgi:hypothetical protein